MFQRYSKIVGFCHSPLTAGNGGLGRGSPRLPSIEVIRAASSPHTNAPAPNLISRLKLKPVPKISSPKRPYSLAWSIAICKRLTAIGYSRSYVYVTLVRADCITCNSHSLDYRVGVTLQNASVHKRTGVALVRVTADKLFALGLRCGKAPFTPVGKPPPPRPRSPESFIICITCSGSFRSNLAQSLITVQSYVLIYVFRVDNTAVFKRYTHLMLVEINLV